MTFADDTGDGDGGGGFAGWMVDVAADAVAVAAADVAVIAAAVSAVGDGSPPVHSLLVVIRWNRGQERRAAPSPRSPVTVPIAWVPAGGSSWRLEEQDRRR